MIHLMVIGITKGDISVKWISVNETLPPEETYVEHDCAVEYGLMCMYD